MRRVQNVFLFFVLGALTGSCGAHSRSLEYELHPVSDGAVAPRALQYLVAVHEAAHVVSSTLYFGNGFVSEVHVDVKCCGKGYHDHIGHTLPARGVPLETREDHMRVMVMFLSGMAAERIFFAEQATDDMHDRAQATMIGKRLLGYAEHDQISESDALLLAREFEEAERRAESIVRANRSIITELAEFLITQPVHDQRRTLSAGMLLAFLETQEIHDPFEVHP